MLKKYFYYCFTLTIILWLRPVLGDAYPQVQILLETTETIAGETLHYPQSGQAKVTAAIITIAPGTSTGWHQHKIPLVAYLLSGELEMEYANGKRVQLKPGQALMEAISVAHIGTNLGKEPVKIFVAFIAEEKSDFTHLTDAPNIPPVSENANAEVKLVDLSALDKRLKFDIRYATNNNFMGKPLYAKAHALLQKPAAEALVKAHDKLQAAGYGLLIFDAYRPWQVTREMWDKQAQHRAYLADPLQGSRHNRGCAIDLTLYDLKTGKQVSMPSGYDEFSERAHPDYDGGSAETRKARDLLRVTMESEGFKVYENEWWHFDYQGWQSYPILNVLL